MDATVPLDSGDWEARQLGRRKQLRAGILQCRDMRWQRALCLERSTLQRCWSSPNPLARKRRSPAKTPALKFSCHSPEPWSRCESAD